MSSFTAPSLFIVACLSIGCIAPTTPTDERDESSDVAESTQALCGGDGYWVADEYGDGDYGDGDYGDGDCGGGYYGGGYYGGGYYGGGAPPPPPPPPSLTCEQKCDATFTSDENTCNLLGDGAAKNSCITIADNKKHKCITLNC